MHSRPGSPRVGFRSIRAHLHAHRGLLIPLFLVLLGLFLSLGSLVPDQGLVYSRTYLGSLAPGNTTLALPSTPAAFLQIGLAGGDCDLRLYLATESESLRFNETGIRPANWLGCANRTAAASGDVADLVLVNGGSGRQSYNVTVAGYVIRTPYGWIALPGAGMVMAGLLFLVPRLVFQKALLARSELQKDEDKK